MYVCNVALRFTLNLKFFLYLNFILSLNPVSRQEQPKTAKVKGLIYFHYPFHRKIIPSISAAGLLGRNLMLSGWSR